MLRQTSELSIAYKAYSQCEKCEEVKERGCFREAKSGKWKGLLRRWCRECDAEAERGRREKRLAERESTPREKRRAIKAYRNWADAWRDDGTR